MALRYINGSDIGKVYHMLNDSQKHKIVKDYCRNTKKNIMVKQFQ